MCTSLIYLDADKKPYLGRTLELSVELPYQIAFFPKSTTFESQSQGYGAVNWQGKYSYLAITMPDKIPTKPLGPNDLKVVEGVNDAGLTFSVQSYPTAGGPDVPPDAKKNVLSVTDLGSWVLSQFSSVAEVREAVLNQDIIVDPVEILGGTKMPFHYSVHDVGGASLVIEFHYGVKNVYDNRVGVMTNAPEFNWHMVNLNNYTFLSNVDHSKSQFGDYVAQAPGAGIAKAGLPVTDTSVDRFVRAAFYAKFAEPQKDPEKSVQMVAHIMNNFDRPRGITIDPPSEGSGHMHLKGQATDAVPTEYTSWTSITDLSRQYFFIRDSGGMNFARYDLKEIGKIGKFMAIPFSRLTGFDTDKSQAFTGAVT